MKRRDFFKAVAGGASLAAVGAVATASLPIKSGTVHRVVYLNCHSEITEGDGLFELDENWNVWCTYYDGRHFWKTEINPATGEGKQGRYLCMADVFREQIKGLTK